MTANKKITTLPDFSVGDFVLWDLTSEPYLKFGLSDSVSKKKYGVVVKAHGGRGIGIKIKFNDGETVFFNERDHDLNNMIILEKAKQ